MREYDLVLFVDETEQSEEVRQLLKESGLPYRAVLASGYNLPAIKFGDTTYGRVDGWVYKIIRDLEAISKKENK